MKLMNSALMLCAALATTACASGEHLFEPARRPAPAPAAGTPRDAYALEIEGREDAEIVRAWEDASRRALRSGLRATPAFRERIRFPQDESYAVAYRFTMRAHERLDLHIDDVDANGSLFVDVFQVIDDEIFRHVQYVPRNGRKLEFDAPVDGDYVVRLQPRIGAGGTWDVTTATEARSSDVASGHFPVQGSGMRAIGGDFGDPRDGGVRSHEGVDIFAPRGTPVVAVVEGRVTGVQHTAIGGRVVWLTAADDGMLYYYAHLDEQLTHEGARVRAGETLGTVGNTGNASGTRPHLHFGVYRPGRIAIDPEPLLERITMSPVMTASTAANTIAPETDAGLGRRLRIGGNNVNVRAAPSPTGIILTRIDADTRVLLLGNIAGWHRVCSTTAHPASLRPASH